MAQIRTVDFLPEIFRTSGNDKFLRATLDQIVQPPDLKRTQGYIGQPWGPGVTVNDSYVVEPTKIRQEYQLEPAVIFTDGSSPQARDLLTYPGYLDALKSQNGTDANPPALFREQFYSWAPFVDFDKIVNYTQYYWLPDGPPVIDFVRDGTTFDMSGIIGQEDFNTQDIFEPNNVQFTNGLRVRFSGNIYPASYRDKIYVVEGVGQAIVLVPWSDLALEGAAYSPEYLITELRQRITTEEPAVLPFVVSDDEDDYFRAVPSDTVAEIDYITINRASLDLNPWTRRNRWFHVDVIIKTAEILGTAVDIDDKYRGARPIVEFQPSLRLFNFGTDGIPNIDLVCFGVTDAFNQVAGQQRFVYDGLKFHNGMRVIFPDETSLVVRSKVWLVEIIDPNSNEPGNRVVNLVDTGEVITRDSCCVSLSGNTQLGKSFWFDGTQWLQGQTKTRFNQAPLFDLYDVNGVSYADPYVYPASDFQGNALFGYKVGTGNQDPILEFPLVYRNYGTAGEIVFDFYLYTGSFTYELNSVPKVEETKNGFVRQYQSQTEFTVKLGYETIIFPSVPYQVFNISGYNTETTADITLDVAVDTSTTATAVKITVNNDYQDSSLYAVSVDMQARTTRITPLVSWPENSIINIQVLSDDVSQTAYYQIPKNLEVNALNQDVSDITLSGIRSHFVSGCRNNPRFRGNPSASNNARDIYNIAEYCTEVVQHSAPATFSALFLRNQELDLFNSLDFNAREYEKFKQILAQTVITNEFLNQTPSEILDQVLELLSSGRSPSGPFYWTDMLPSGVYQNITITYQAGQSTNYDLSRAYDFTQANYQGLLIYLTPVGTFDETQLIIGRDYQVRPDQAVVEITTTLQTGDIISIREYSQTWGSYVPATPTKLGLHPRFLPEIYVDSTYINPAEVIRGHDGSITPAFGDIRDAVLLEFESRIYNNIKVTEDIPFQPADIIPGKFRSTEYTLQQVREILDFNFLAWVGLNKIDYQTQSYYAASKFTWNYRLGLSVLGDRGLPGFWRGIYRYFYDTTEPHLRPWEMLGFSQAPQWWVSTYGSAPYTRGNRILWDDVRDGIIREPGNVRVDVRYVRPEINSVIPVDDEGHLLDPEQALIRSIEPLSTKNNWIVGDGGPAETAWINSSTYPFVLQKLYALLKPSQYFTYCVDRDLYKYDAALDQWVYRGRGKLKNTNVEIYDGSRGIIKNSYVNFVVEYNKILGLDISGTVEEYLYNIDIRLAYRAAGYTDKRYLRLISDRSTPGSSNRSLLIPDESYNILLYENETVEQLTYSAVNILKTELGFQVSGNGLVRPYFRVFKPRGAGSPQIVNVSGSEYQFPQAFDEDNVTVVPYGQNFRFAQEVVDFLCGYGAYLENHGVVYQQSENNVLLDWPQMAYEFLVWARQNWGTGSLLQLNPNAEKFLFTRENLVAGNLLTATFEDRLIDQNRQPLAPSDYTVNRIDNTIELTSLSEKNLGYFNLRLTNYEHVVVFDNNTIFADVIYDARTGLRQNRLLFQGVKTSGWNGTLDAPGFFIYQQNVTEWDNNLRYNKGDVVYWKGTYYQAIETVYPSVDFIYSRWSKIGRFIENGTLLPNLATKAQQSSKFYDQYYLNLNVDSSLLGYGLTGFRPRAYMESIELDLVSQINVYNDFIRSKGTTESIRYFDGARVDNNRLNYDTYENWAVQRAIFGSTATNAAFDIVLDINRVYSNPSTIQLVGANSVSSADQVVGLDQIYDSTFAIQDANVLPQLEDISPSVPLPTAGYVNTSDVDYRVFDIVDIAELKTYIQDIKDNTLIWVAQASDREWAVYKCQQVNGTVLAVQDNLSGQSRVTFNAPHGLGINEYIFIRFFDTRVDGIYQVRAVLTAKTILIDLTIGDGNNSTIIGNGIALVLRSVRLALPKDMVGLTQRIDLVNGNKIWIDNDQGSWQVIEKQQPWSRSESYDLGAASGADLGASAAISGDAAWSLIGSPGYQATLGFQTSRNIGGAYLARNTLYSGASLIAPLVFARDMSQSRPRLAAARAFGSTLTIADQTWAAISAPGTIDTTEPLVNDQGLVCIYRYDGTNLQQYQLLVEPINEASGSWGQALAFSQDENTLIVSNGKDRVRVYRRISYQIQSETYVTQDTSTIFFADKIKINRPYQLDLRIAGASISVDEYRVDVTLGLVTVPYSREPRTVELTRRLEVFYRNVGPEITDIEDYLVVDARFNLSGRCINPGILRLIVSGGTVGILRPGIDYVIHPRDALHPTGVWISITDPSLYGSSVYVRTGDYFQEVSSFSRPLAQSFGRDLAIDATAARLAIGNAHAQLAGTAVVDGTVEIYDRGQLRYEITSPTVAAEWEAGKIIYDPADPLFARIFVNGELEYAQTANNFSTGNYYYTYDSATSTANVRFNTNYLQVGDIIVFDSGYYGNTQQPSQILTNPVDSRKNNAASNLSQFGSAVAMSAAGDTLLAGAPYDQRALSFAGSFSHFTDTGPQWGRISTGDLTSGANVLAGDNFVVNGYVVTFSSAANTATAVAQQINLSFPANITIAARTQGNVVTVYVKNPASRSPLDQLKVSPTQLTANTAQDAYRKLNFQPLGQGQLNFNAVSGADARFGTKIAIDQRANIALIYSQYGSARLNTSFDRRTTTFDADSTEFDTGIAESGSVDLYQLFAGTGPDDLPAYAQIQQVVDPDIQPGDAWGSSMAIDRTGTRVLIGSSQAGQHGRFAPFIGWQSAFKEIRRQPVVADTRAFNSVSLYNKTTKIDLAWLDFFDPLQGRILGAAQQNIDYIGFNDPAQYNVNGVNNRGIAWTEEYVGSIWWDVTNVRFIDYHQGDIEESARLWGTLFPGSQVDIYQWVSSPVAPSVYPGPGTPYSYNSYVIFNGVDDTNKVVTKFYFWVRGITSVSTNKDKTLSPVTIAQYIENPRSSGIPYIAAINPSTVSIYNCSNYLLPDNTVLHIDYDRIPQDQSIYAEYDLIKEEDELSFLDDSTYRKMVDSYAGIDSQGSLVPDPRLGQGAKYGVSFRPRQTMFRDRLAALKNYITYINSILINYDITYIRTLHYWNLQEEYPAENTTDPQGQLWWNVQVQNLVELNYQNFYTVPLGFRYLVLQDATNRNGWSIYQVTSADGITRTAELLRRQSYRTADYWRYVDYYAPGFDSSLRPKFTVDYYSDLVTLSNVAVGDLVQVNTSTGIGYEIYQWQVVDSVPGWHRVAAENGTVQIDISVYDYALLAAAGTDPLLETRNIILGINEDILTGDLLIFKNRSLALTFKYIIAEQVDVNWLYKTSLIDVIHPLGTLTQSATYKRDNQDFVLDYVQEAKPYHAYLKDFSLVYTSSLELTNLDVSDFDLPAAFDPRQQTFISPILDPNSRFSQPRPAPNSSFFANAGVWQESSYSSWYGNYGISVSGINILDSGIDFTQAPIITIQSPLLDVIRAPKFATTINAQGSITGISVLNSGLFRANISNTSYSNAISQAYANVIITSIDGRGGNARAYIQWTAEPVRQFNTLIKYDRVNLRPSFGPWQANSLYFTGDLVKFGPKVWQRNNYESLTYEGREFDFTRWSSVASGNSLLDGVDRTYGFSTQDPSVAIPGLTYPGVRLRRGFLGTFDTSPFSTDPFESDFGSLDTLLSGGSFDDFIPRPSGGSNVVVTGGAFVDTYSSHAPEELVPGATFDTLDLVTRTAVGEDSSWQYTSTGTSLGWSTQVNSIKYVVAGAGRTFSFAGALDYIHQIVVNQITQGRRLIQGTDYTVDWASQRINLAPGRADSDDVIGIDCYAVGGGYQLLRQEFVAGNVISSFIIDVPTDNANYIYDPRVSLSNIVILDNGNIVTANFAATDTSPYDNRSNITLPANITAGNLVSVVAIGFSYPTVPTLGGGAFTYSLPNTAVILGNGSNSYAVDSYHRYPGDNSTAVTVVEKDYLRLRGAASVSHVVRGNTRVFEIPYQTDVLSQGLDQWANRVNVWVNGSNTYLTTDNVGLPVYLPWTYSANYSARRDILEVTLDQDPGPANSNVRVTVSITANIVDYIVSDSSNRVDFAAAVGNSNTLLITSWNDTRQEYLDNRIFVGKNYDIVENSPNNVVTCGRWDNDSNTIALGFITEGIWFGNTVANVTVSGNLVANITINGIPYSFDNFDLLPWNLANVLIVNGIETNEPGYIPIQSGYDIYADGLPTGIKVSAPRRSNTANNVPYFIDSVTEFINFQGRTQYAVLLDRPAETLGIGWTFNDSTVDNSTISLKGITAADVSGTGNVWVAVGDRGTIVRSENGSTWATVLSYITFEEASIVVSSDANANALATEPDAGGNSNVIVTNSSSTSIGNLSAVASNTSYFVTVGEAGNIWYSNTGATWEKAVSGIDANLRCVSWTEDSISPISPLYWTDEQGNLLIVTEDSTDPMIPGNALIGIGFYSIGNRWIAGGEQGKFLISFDANVWYNTNPLPDTTDTINAVLYDTNIDFRNRYLAFTEKGHIYYSDTEGSRWGEVANVGTPINGALQVGNSYFAVGDNGLILRNRISGNSLIWDTIHGVRQEVRLGDGSTRSFSTNQVQVNEASGVQVTVSGTRLRTGIDFSVDSVNPVSITIGGRGLSPAQYANTIQPPGLGAPVVITGYPLDLYSLTYDSTENRLMTTGANGLVLTSTDLGNTWYQKLPFVSCNLHATYHASNLFVAVGEHVAAPGLYQRANLPPSTQAAIISSPRGDDIQIEFVPEIEQVTVGQLVEGDYIRRQSLITSVDYVNRSITVDNPLHSNLIGPQFNSVIRIYTIEKNQRYDLGENITSGDRLWVSVDGRRCFENYSNGFIVDGSVIEITANVRDDFANVSNSSVVQILTSSENSVRNELNTRIWKDMRDNTATYRQTPNNTTTLSANLGINDDEIFLSDASQVQEPAEGTFGMLLVGTERIAYRQVNRLGNTVSGLLRGLAGTSQLGDPLDYDTANANSASYSGNSTNILRLAHTVGQTVVDVSAVNTVPLQFRDRFNAYTSKAIAGNVDTVSRNSNIANVRVVYDNSATDILLFQVGDIINIQADITAFNERSAVILSASEVGKDFVKNLTFQYIQYDNLGANTELTTVTGNIAKMDYFNTNLSLVSNAQVMVSVAGTPLANPQASFDLTGANVGELYVANTANIPGQAPLFVYANTEVLVTVNGAQVIPSTSYQISNLNPLIVEFAANVLPANAQMIITAQTQFQAAALDPVRVILKQEPRNNQLVTIAADYSQSWYLSNGQGLQYQDTVAGRFFRDEV